MRVQADRQLACDGRLKALYVLLCWSKNTLSVSKRMGAVPGFIEAGKCESGRDGLTAQLHE